MEYLGAACGCASLRFLQYLRRIKVRSLIIKVLQFNGQKTDEFIQIGPLYRKVHAKHLIIDTIGPTCSPTGAP